MQREHDAQSCDNPRPDLTVVVPAYNAEKYLGIQLRALLAQEPPFEFEIVVVDNRSTDGTPSVARNFAARNDRVRLVKADHAQGVNAARNVGCRAARANSIVLADADDEAHSGWMQAMHSALRRFDCVGGTIVPFGGSGANGSRSALRSRHGFLPTPSGANCGFRRSVFISLGGFNESYAGGGDEVEFFWRAQLAGFTLGAVPDAEMGYRLRESETDEWRQVLGYGRARVRLFVDFKSHGIPRSRLGEAVKTWAWIATRFWKTRSDADFRRQWRRVLAHRTGRLVGSLRHREFYL